MYESQPTLIYIHLVFFFCLLFNKIKSCIFIPFETIQLKQEGQKLKWFISTILTDLQNFFTLIFLKALYQQLQIFMQLSSII